MIYAETRTDVEKESNNLLTTIKEPNETHSSNYGSGFFTTLQSNIANLSSGYFALVMATGIVSIAAYLFNFIQIAQSLFYFNIGAYILLCILYIARLLFYTKYIFSDFNDHGKNPGFLTFVAGSCVLGNQFILLADNYQFASYLFYAGLVSWLFLIYSFFTVITVKNQKPSLREGISGVWLLVIVSTQSVSILGTQLSETLPVPQDQMLFFTFTLFLCGCMFYVIIITLVVYRLSFFELQAEEFGPPYWINMGAVAITTLAGSTLMLHQHKSEFLVSLFPFLKGFTFFFWSIGTWWIPLIVILGIWRHLIKQLPFRYHPQYWGMVFPLGMYTTCTAKLSQASGLPFINAISFYFVYIALAAWSITFIAMVYTVCNETCSAIKKSSKTTPPAC